MANDNIFEVNLAFSEGQQRLLQEFTVAMNQASETLRGIAETLKSTAQTTKETASALRESDPEARTGGMGKAVPAYKRRVTFADHVARVPVVGGLTGQAIHGLYAATNMSSNIPTIGAPLSTSMMSRGYSPGMFSRAAGVTAGTIGAYGAMTHPQDIPYFSGGFGLQGAGYTPSFNPLAQSNTTAAKVWWDNLQTIIGSGFSITGQQVTDATNQMQALGWMPPGVGSSAPALNWARNNILGFHGNVQAAANFYDQSVRYGVGTPGQAAAFGPLINAYALGSQYNSSQTTSAVQQAATQMATQGSMTMPQAARGIVAGSTAFGVSPEYSANVGNNHLMTLIGYGMYGKGMTFDQYLGSPRRYTGALHANAYIGHLYEAAGLSHAANFFGLPGAVPAQQQHPMDKNRNLTQSTIDRIMRDLTTKNAGDLYKLSRSGAISGNPLATLQAAQDAANKHKTSAPKNIVVGTANIMIQHAVNSDRPIGGPAPR